MRSISVVALIALTSPARADDASLAVERSAKPTSLSELFATAVRVAPQLEAAAYSLALAEAQSTSAEAPHDLVITLSGDLRQTRGAPDVPGLPGDTSTSFSSQLSIRKLLPTNGTLELIGSTAGIETDISGMTTETVTSALKLRLTQPLLKGFGPASAYGRSDAAELHLSAEGHRRAAVARAFAVAVVSAYWQLALAWRELDVRRASSELARKQITLIEAGIRTGKFSQSELLPVQQALVTRQQDALAAELRIIDRSIELRRIVGLELDSAASPLRPAALPPLATANFDTAAIVARAVATSDELRAAVAEQRSAESALASSRRNTLPRADLRVEAGPIGTDSTIAGSLEAVPRGYSIGAGLVVETAIGNHEAAGLLSADRARALDAVFQARLTRAEVIATVTRAVYEARMHYEAARLGAKAVKLAEASVEAEQKKFELGKSSSSEVVRRQADLEAARLRESSERASYELALAQLAAADGTILAKYGIRIVDPWFSR